MNRYISLATFDETKPMPTIFRKFLRFTTTCHFGSKTKTEPLEIKPAQSGAIPLDEKILDDLDYNLFFKSDENTAAEWARLHKYINWINFAIQFSAVTLTQGKSHSKSFLSVSTIEANNACSATYLYLINSQTPEENWSDHCKEYYQIDIKTKSRISSYP